MAAAGDAVVDLPREILIEILNKLPVKSILRFKSVCKLWYSLVSLPDFISDYSVRNLNKNGVRVLLGLSGQPPSSVYSYSSHDELFTESNEHNIYIPDRFVYGGADHVQIIGSCNGLICLSACYSRLTHEERVYIYVRTFLIWNPTIRKTVELPPLASQNRSMPRTYVGFGFDSKTNDYKVLCIVRGESEDHGEGVSKIFDLRNGVWRRTSPLMRPWDVNGSSPDCYLNEAVHWSWHEIYRQRYHSKRILLSFNMSDECFREIKLPNCTEFDSDDVLTFTRSVILDRLLSVVVWKRVGYYSFGKFDSCSVWTMTEYGITDSWTKISNIDLESAQILPINRFWPSKFHFCENGEVLMVQDHGDGEDVGQQDSVVLYNIRNRERKHLYSVTKYIWDMCLYHESLVLA